MAVRQRMDLRQTQALVMTPQLQQAIKLLELSNQELSAYIEDELERNPLLEREDAGGDESGDGEDSDRTAPTSSEPADPIDTRAFTETVTMPDAQDSPLDLDYDNLWTNDAPVMESWPGGFEHDSLGSSATLEQTLSGTISLRDHLIEQINVDLSELTDRMIGLALVEQLDEAGYISSDIAQIADRLGCPVAQVETTLRRLQQFDPPGIFARSLAECLALQLRDRDRLDPAMEKLLEHLDLLAQGERDRLMRLCGVDADDLADMAAEIRTLNPKPAESFSTAPIVPVVPDILMRRASDGSWIVELNPEALPRVLVNERYATKVRQATTDKAARDYVSDRVNAANWLIRALQQRATTILKVAAEIVRHQDDFFRRGVQYLKPLTRREIADTISMHESTVSRVTTNKYMATPRGLYELRYFFGSALADAEGGVAHAAKAVQKRIQDLIAGEKPEDILSDDRLAEILRQDGIEVARRTVAKYRESLRIPTSSQRRRAKALQAR